MTATVSCVDVGQGDCTVAVDAATGHGLLIDCPAGKHGEALAELDQLGLTELKVAVVSHSQMDHFGGVLEVLERLAGRFTGYLHYNHDSFLSTPVTGLDRRETGMKLRALIQRAAEYGDRVRRADTEVPELSAGSVAARLLAPTYGDINVAVATGDPNLASGIVLLRVESDCVLIGGDAPLASWERVAESLPKGAIIRWPHHGGAIGPDNDAHQRLYELLEPSVVVVSVGARNTYGHPSSEFFAAAGGRPGELLCTQATSVCAPSCGSGKCAGTVRVHAGNAGPCKVAPGRADHRRYIETLGNAQCLPTTPDEK